MQRRFVTIDVFPDGEAGGNPLAVVLDGQGLSARQMQILAKGFNFSETTFVMPPADPASAAKLRIFTPAQEIPFAGHPNIGTALVLARRITPTPKKIVLEQLAGPVAIEITVADGKPVAAELTAPEPFVRGPNSDPVKLATALGLDPSAVLIGAHRPTIASVGLPFLFAEMSTRRALRDVSPEPAKLAPILKMTGAIGLYLYTKDGADAAHDFHARMFFMAEQLTEDPATGSAAAAFAALRAMLSPLERQTLSFGIGQGADMGRPSLIRARATKRAGKLLSAQVGGGGIEMKQGTFTLAGEG
jgi:trans-2,3-dihydro-3-hydroxyanthranilate isomerase